MFISGVQVRDFRSYPHAQLQLQPGVTILLGPNGSGKTNLVEAMAYPAMMGSHRVSNDAALVRQGQPHALIQVVAVRADRQVSIDVHLTPGSRTRARLNRNPVPRVRDVAGVLQVVMFAPTDVELVRGDPAARRRFLDDLLVCQAPRWAGVRADYDKAVRQRSALLKSLAAQRGRGSGISMDDDYTLHVWDQALVRHGAALTQARIQLVEQLNPLLAKAYGQLSGTSQAPTHCQAHYQPAAGEIPAGASVEQVEQVLHHQVEQSRRQELARGVCLVGPHRDELVVRLGINPALPVRTHASHGETWSVALALRVASAWLLRGGQHDLAQSPIVILDDVLAELDPARRQELAQILGDFEQVIITAADPADLPDQLEGRVVRVPGEVSVLDLTGSTLQPQVAGALP